MSRTYLGIYKVQPAGSRDNHKKLAKKRKQNRRKNR